MGKYTELFKNGTIDFSKILLKKYFLLGLDEIDAVLLMLIADLLNKGEKISPAYLQKNMAATADVINNHLLKLINAQFVTLSLKGKKEAYSLDVTYDKLSDLMEKEERLKSVDNQINEDIKQTVELLEKEFQKLPSALDLELIRKWVVEDKFAFAKIKDAVLVALKNKKTSLQFVDVILNKKEKPTMTQDETELEKLFNQVYGKIK